MATVMTDIDLRRNVEAELNWEPGIKSPAAIGVRVKDGIVTLTGYVESYAEKLTAERAALGVAGVKAAVNNLEVRCPLQANAPMKTSLEVRHKRSTGRPVYRETRSS